MNKPNSPADRARISPVVLDSAMGTRLIELGLDFRTDDPSLWVLDRPTDILRFHRADVEAGADALLTNTFGANRINLARFGRESETLRLNRAAVALAREAAGEAGLVIGSVGPSGVKSESAYVEQLLELAAAGVDALVLETHTPMQALQGLKYSRKHLISPILVSLVFPPDVDVSESLKEFGDFEIAAIGVNCHSGPAECLPILRSLRTQTSLPLYVKPGAFLPGDPPIPPESFAGAVPELLALGVRYIGGCCGTTDQHVSAIRRALDSIT